MILLAADSPMIRNTRKRIRNRPARNLATPNAAPAIVVNPSRAAMTPITRNTSAMWSIGLPSTVSYCQTRTDANGWARSMLIGRSVEAQYAWMDAFLTAAIDEAEHGLREGGIPIGAALVHAGRILGRGHNRRVQSGSAVLHGEMDALERAGRQPASVYRECVMYTTLSPCSMCTGAILLYGIRHVVVGENQTFMGEEDLLRARGVRVEVIQDPQCIAMMERFIGEHPDLWREDIGV